MIGLCEFHQLCSVKHCKISSSSATEEATEILTLGVIISDLIEVINEVDWKKVTVL